MEGWLITLIAVIVIFIVLPMIVAALITKEGGKSYCFIDSGQEKGCMFLSLHDCVKNNGTRFKTFDDCKKYWDTHK